MHYNFIIMFVNMVGEFFGLLYSVKYWKQNSLNKLLVYYNLNNCIFVHHIELQLSWNVAYYHLTISPWKYLGFLKIYILNFENRLPNWSIKNCHFTLYLLYMEWICKFNILFRPGNYNTMHIYFYIQIYGE